MYDLGSVAHDTYILIYILVSINGLLIHQPSQSYAFSVAFVPLSKTDKSGWSYSIL